MPENKKISFILPYFGAAPNWLDYYLVSCEANPGYEWIILSDFSPPPKLPLNIRWINSSLEQVRDLASERLNLNVRLEHPYKLTDLKPAYGLIFQDYLKDSSHWGYCDLDLAWGKFDHFITDDILEDFDIISPGKDFHPGHMQILKNQISTNRLFRLVDNWQMVFTDPRCFSFDEILRRTPFDPAHQSINETIRSDVDKHLTWIQKRQSKDPASIRSFAAGLKRIGSRNRLMDFNAVINQQQSTGVQKIYCANSYDDDVYRLVEGKERFEITWDQGVLRVGDREILYYHFQLSKFNEQVVFEKTSDSSFKISGRIQIR